MKKGKKRKQELLNLAYHMFIEKGYMRIQVLMRLWLRPV